MPTTNAKQKQKREMCKGNARISNNNNNNLGTNDLTGNGN